MTGKSKTSAIPNQPPKEPKGIQKFINGIKSIFHHDELKSKSVNIDQPVSGNFTKQRDTDISKINSQESAAITAEIIKRVTSSNDPLKRRNTETTTKSKLSVEVSHNEFISQMPQKTPLMNRSSTINNHLAPAGTKTPNSKDQVSVSRPNLHPTDSLMLSMRNGKSFLKNSFDFLRGSMLSFSPNSEYNSRALQDDENWTPESINDFSIYKQIGKGAFSKVYLCRRRADGKIYALKSMRKDLIIKMNQVEHVQNEKELMMGTQNPFLLPLYWTLQDKKHLFMLMEYMGGGDLFTNIKSHGRFDPDTARFYAGEIFLGLSFLHGHGIVYRDLKPENILVDFEGHCKLADFGFAKKIIGSTKTFCGTPSYIAPEVILRKPYGVVVDWWTFGIIIFEMLSGCSPFQDQSARHTYERITSGNIRWPTKFQKYFTEEVFNLITSLIVFKPSDRLGYASDEEIKEHIWFAGLDWNALEEKKISPPVIVARQVRLRSESQDTRPSMNLSSSFRGSGDLNAGNSKGRNPKFGSVNMYGAEIELSFDDEKERSWSGGVHVCESNGLTQRVNSGQLSQLKSKVVRIVGTVLGLQGNQAMLESSDKGQVILYLSSESQILMNGQGVYEVIGTVQDDLSIQEVSSCHFTEPYGAFD